MASEEDRHSGDNMGDQDSLSDHSGDMDAEPDSDQEQDLDKMLGTWLGELEIMTKNLDSNAPATPTSPPLPPPITPSTNGLDNFQFSLLNLEAAKDSFDTSLQDSPDVDLDALLGDLCQMEQSLNAQMQDCDSKGDTTPQFPSYNVTDSTGAASVTRAPPVIHTVPATPPVTGNTPLGLAVTPGEEDVAMPPPPPQATSDAVDSEMPLPPPPPPPPPPADIPDNQMPSPPPEPPQAAPPLPPKSQTADTAPIPNSTFVCAIPPPPSVVTAPPSSQKTAPASLSIEMGGGTPAKSATPSSLTPMSPISPGQTPYSMSVRVKLQDIEAQLASDTSLTEEEKAAKLKAEKIKIALEKLKKARVQKLIIRVYSEDGSSKTLFADETMTCRQIVHTLVDKNHLEEKADWALVEQIPELYMERVLEDHEHLVTDVLLHWKRDTTSRLLFSERREKYAVFRNPQNFLLSSHTSQVATEFAEKSKQSLIDEFFSEGRQGVPEIEGPLFLKAEGKKSWKKYFFVLRASGLYYTPKGKSKSSKDLVCLVQFEHVNVYNGVGWRKKYKAPSDHCFALKHPQLQQKSKYTKYLSAEDYRTCQRWMAGIRIAKYGRVMLSNYTETQREMVDYSSSVESMSTSSLGDSSSISSMHSSASSHSTQSSLGVSPSGSTLSVPPVQVNTLPTRQSSMGNMFASAWKKGKEKESKVDSPNLDRYCGRSPGPGERIPDEGTFQFKAPLVSQSHPTTQRQTPNDNDDVERTLMELEMNLAHDQEPTQLDRQQSQVHARPAFYKLPAPLGPKPNLNNSNAGPVHVHVTARNAEAVTVKVSPMSPSFSTSSSPSSSPSSWTSSPSSFSGCEARSNPPPVAPKPTFSSSPSSSCLSSSTNKTSPGSDSSCAKQTSSIISSRPRDTNLGRSESKRVQFKEVLEEKIPVRGRAAEKEPIASPPSSPLKPILNTSPQNPTLPSQSFSKTSFASQSQAPVSSTFQSPTASHPQQPPRSCSFTPSSYSPPLPHTTLPHTTFSPPNTSNINTIHQLASGGLYSTARQPRALPTTPSTQSNGYGHPQQPPAQQGPPRQANSSFLAELNSALVKPKPGGPAGKPPVSPRPPLSPRPKPLKQETATQQNITRPGGPSSPKMHSVSPISPRDSMTTFSNPPKTQLACKQGSPVPSRAQYPPTSPGTPPKSNHRPREGPASPRVRDSPPSSPASPGGIFVLPPSPTAQLKRAFTAGSQVKRSGSNKGAKPPPPPRRDGTTQLTTGDRKQPPSPPQRAT
ncbi:ras-associated and pleckstrin homology domains-containing protein 1-like isoform X3 [Acanthaster planci]|uniref:Ras-associated and pleckstrin homology domains-containing protein 1-like isoform X3 n=1 Tax=Acanthaster planci TaxID=133434 RepID=A0A8B7YTV3_ACAPL|nr:ras-associated and pleckstrin homology domains-containing protein 1-like isoform X3 [Acanthaster planci]